MSIQRFFKDDVGWRQRTADALLDRAAFEKIRCPRCYWRPSPSSMWCCNGFGTPEPAFQWCGTVWNTFLTHGQCPGCTHRWRWTSCLRCGEWSPHDDWYEADDRPTSRD